MRFEVGLHKHHLDELAAKPTTALLELIWNALDAEARHVEIKFGRNALGGIEDIRVEDDGHGMTRAEAEDAFAKLGASWKLEAARSRSGSRVLHGKHGKGRFRAAGLGHVIRWETVVETGQSRSLTRIDFRASDRTRIDISDPEPTARPVGTKVSITGISDHPEGIGERTADRLLGHLALYIEQYHPAVTYDGVTLDSASIQGSHESYLLEVDGDDAAQLDVIEWTRPFERGLYLCTPDGMAMEQVAPGIQAPGFDFTAYIRWQGFADEKRVVTAELDAESAAVIEAARTELRRHFRQRTEDELRTQVEDWKSEHVYPFDQQSETTTDEATRELFDVVAVTAREAVNAGDTQGRRFSLRLLRQAIENDPGSLRRVLQEVLDLPEEKLEELDDLLKQTSLTRVIALSRSVTGRLEFLKALEELVLDPDFRKVVLERRQLHRILATETWVFGEQHALAVDDESLRTALKRHIRILGREELAPEVAAQPVTSPSGQEESILDLMLARSVPQGTRRREHLVVELKRPSVSIGPKEAQQIREYALAVAQDDRFDKSEVQWDFVAVSSNLSGTVIQEAAQSQLPPGQIASFEDGRVRVWARTWGEVIEDAVHRLKYVRDHIDYDPSARRAFKHLREKHAAFVPSVVGEPD